MAALAGPLIGLAGGLLGGLFGGPSKQQKNLWQEQTNALRQQQQIAGQSSQLGTQYSNMARQPLQQSLNYWQTLLSGNPNAMMSLLQPEVSQYANANNAALQNISQFAPRGGGRTTSLAELPFTQNRNIANMFASLRPQAAGQVGTLGSELGSLGLAGYGQGNAGYGSAASGYLSQAQQQQNARELQMWTASKVGAALYDKFKNVDWGNLGGGGGGGGSHIDWTKLGIPGVGNTP